MSDPTYYETAEAQIADLHARLARITDERNAYRTALNEAEKQRDNAVESAEVRGRALERAEADLQRAREALRDAEHERDGFVVVLLTLQSARPPLDAYAKALVDHTLDIYAVKASARAALTPVSPARLSNCTCHDGHPYDLDCPEHPRAAPVVDPAIEDALDAAAGYTPAPPDAGGAVDVPALMAEGKQLARDLERRIAPLVGRTPPLVLLPDNRTTRPNSMSAYRRLIQQGAVDAAPAHPVEPEGAVTREKHRWDLGGIPVTGAEFAAACEEFGSGGVCGCDGAVDDGCPLCTRAKAFRWLADRAPNPDTTKG